MKKENDLNREPDGNPPSPPLALMKTKLAFWAPPDIRASLQASVNQGDYSDHSKAIVGLLRKALREDMTLSASLRDRLDRLAVDLDRTPEIVLRLCIEGILEMIDGPESTIPLVVEEIRLRQKRRPR